MCEFVDMLGLRGAVGVVGAGVAKKGRVGGFW